MYLSQVIDHFLSCGKTVISLGIVPGEEVFLGITVSTVKDIVHTGLFALKVVMVDIKLA